MRGEGVLIIATDNSTQYCTRLLQEVSKYMAERASKMDIVSFSSLSIILVILCFVVFSMCKYRQHGYFVGAAKHHTRTSLRLLPRMLNGDLSSRHFSIRNGLMVE